MATMRAQNIEEMEAQILAISARAKAIADLAGPEVSTKRPHEGSWSVVECLEHLNVCADSMFAVWPQAISQARPRKGSGNAPYKMDFWGRMLSWILEPPARIKSKTPKWFEPAPSLEIGTVLQGFLDRQERLIATLQKCQGRAIDQVKMASTVDSRIHYSVWSGFVVTAAHERRHLWQAEQALDVLRTAR
jgi:DinB superfamily